MNSSFKKYTIMAILAFAVASAARVRLLVEPHQSTDPLGPTFRFERFAMKKREAVGSVEGSLIVFVYCICGIAGCLAGLIVSFYLGCVMTGHPFNMQNPTPDGPPWELIMPVGIIFGGFIFGLPLFVLCVWPFYTKQAIIDLVDRYPPPPIFPNFLLNWVYAICWFWVDLFYGGEKTETKF